MAITDVQLVAILTIIAVIAVGAYVQLNRTYKSAVSHEIGHGIMAAYYGAPVGYIRMIGFTGGVTAFGSLVDETPNKIARVMIAGYVAEEIHAGRVPSMDIFNGGILREQYAIDLAVIEKLNLTPTELSNAINETYAVLTEPGIYKYARSLECILASRGEIGSGVIVLTN